MDLDPRDFDDPRDRIEDLRDRDGDPRDAFTRDLDLPRGREREIVRDVIASTRCAVRNRARSQPSVRFEWSPVVISETTTIVLLIRDLVIFDISASSG